MGVSDSVGGETGEREETGGLVAGEGFGHTIRSRVVIEQLNKNHKIKVLSSAKSYNYLKKFFDVEKINYFKIIYRSNKAALFLTLLNNLLTLQDNELELQREIVQHEKAITQLEEITGVCL